jgi:hypothetical protein
MPNNIAELAGRKPYICCHAEIMKPQLDFFVAGTNVNVRRLVSFIGIEEGTIRTPIAGPSAFHLMRRSLRIVAGANSD